MCLPFFDLRPLYNDDFNCQSAKYTNVLVHGARGGEGEGVKIKSKNVIAPSAENSYFNKEETPTPSCSFPAKIGSFAATRKSATRLGAAHGALAR
jgi:hypothetical protein